MMKANKAPTLSVKEAAIQLLSRRDHGIYELEQKLTIKVTSRRRSLKQYSCVLSMVIWMIFAMPKVR